MARQKCLDGFQIVVEQMLVVDLVESQVRDDLFHVEKLDDKNAVWLEAVSNTIGDRMQFLEMEEDAGSVDDIEGPVEGRREIRVEETLNSLDASVVRHCGRRGG